MRHAYMLSANVFNMNRFLRRITKPEFGFLLHWNYASRIEFLCNSKWMFSVLNLIQIRWVISEKKHKYILETMYPIIHEYFIKNTL
jgi:hypothetical protein